MKRKDSVSNLLLVQVPPSDASLQELSKFERTATVNRNALKLNDKVAQFQTMSNCLESIDRTLYIEVLLPEGQADCPGVAPTKLPTFTPSFRKMLCRAAPSGEK